MWHTHTFEKFPGYQKCWFNVDKGTLYFGPIDDTGADWECRLQ